MLASTRPALPPCVCFDFTHQSSTSPGSMLVIESLTNCLTCTATKHKEIPGCGWQFRAIITIVKSHPLAALWHRRSCRFARHALAAEEYVARQCHVNTPAQHTYPTPTVRPTRAACCMVRD